MSEMRSRPVCKLIGSKCNVAVVGGAGFLGSHCVEHLIEDRGCSVLVLDNLSIGRREWVHPKAIFEHCDITGSEDRLRKLFLGYKIKYVLNWAAMPYIPVSFERPLHVFNINAMGALQVINAAHEAGCEGILQISSAEIYGSAGEKCKDQASCGITESDSVEPRSSYGAAKAAIDAMVRVRWKEAKVPVIALRQFNCCGERESHPYVIPEIIGQLSKHLPANDDQYSYSPPVLKLGNNSSRDFLYAGDAVRMAVELLEVGEFGQVYNSGSESVIKIYDLAQEIARIMGFGRVEIGVDEAKVRPWEIWSLQSDNSKLYSVISYRPKVGLQEALKKTVAWFIKNNVIWPWQISSVVYDGITK